MVVLLFPILFKNITQQLPGNLNARYVTNFFGSRTSRRFVLFVFRKLKVKIEESARKEACARERTIPLARKALTREAPHAHLAHTSFSPSLITGKSFTTHKNVMSFVRQKT